MLVWRSVRSHFSVSHVDWWNINRHTRTHLRMFHWLPFFQGVVFAWYDFFFLSFVCCFEDSFIQQQYLLIKALHKFESLITCSLFRSHNWQHLCPPLPPGGNIRQTEHFLFHKSGVNSFMWWKKQWIKKKKLSGIKKKKWRGSLPVSVSCQDRRGF